MNEGEGKVMRKPPRKSTESIISKPLWISIVAYGFSLTVAVIGVEVYASYSLQLEHEVVNNVTFYTLILAQLWNVFNLPDADISFVKNQITKNSFIWYALILCILLVVIAYFIAPVREALDLVEIDLSLLTLIFGASLVPIGLVQLLKRVFKIIK
jgi:Ca2+-transporting ATPase